MSHVRRTVIVLVIAVVTALALPTLAQADEPNYVVQNSATSCSNADVSGDLAVWEDASGNQDIWAKNLAGGSAFPVVQLGSSVQQTPAVDGTTVVWADDRASGAVYKIYGATVNPSTGAVTEFPISTTSGVQSDPDVSGRFVVWANYVSATSTYDIYGYDLLTHTQFAVCTNSAKQDQPAVSGDLVVWRDYRNNATYADIYAARIDPTSHAVTEFPICAQPSAPVHLDSQPAVGGAVVAWLDQRGGGNARIYAAVVSGTSVVSETQVSTTATRSAGAPAVNGNLVAWTYAGGTSNDDIYGCRLGGSEFPIVSTTQYESAAAVSASRTVWTNRSTWDIYGADIGGFGWSAGVSIDGGAQYAATRAVTLALSGASSVGPATQMCFSSDGATWSGWEACTTTRSYQLPAGDGAKTVYVQFKDAEGNVSPTKSDGIVLDENAPVTSDDAPEGWATGDVTVTLTADDGGGSGVAGIVCDVDGRGNDTYTQPIVLSGDGLHTITYCAVDNLGHTEDWRQVEVRIDGTKPATSDNAGDGWHASGFALHLDAYDFNGVDRTEYSVNGGAWETGTDPVFRVGAKRSGCARTVVVQYRSIDVAGNVEETRSCTVRIDRRRPMTTTDYDGQPSGSDVIVTLTGYDAHSGVGQVWYSVDGGAPTLGSSVLIPAPSDHSNDGVHVVTYYSVDNVGNVESVRGLAVTIDTSAGGASLKTSASVPARGLKSTSARASGTGSRLGSRLRSCSR